MSNNSIKRVLSHDSGPFWQFVKYGVIGVLSTLVQMVAFYAMASTCLKSLPPDDWAVRLFSLPSVEVTDAVRAYRFAIATALGFVLANVFCWLMNRKFVFKPGKHIWYVEFLLFISVSAVAMILATALSWVLIKYIGLMTSYAALIEVVVSFAFNFAIRKFIIFKG